MIFTSITIDYLNQLIRTAYPGVESILVDLRTIGQSFGATVSQRTTPMIMSFPDTRPFDLIQASEGISLISKLLIARTNQLRGATLVVHHGETLDEAVLVMQSARFTISSNYGAQVTREGKHALRDYYSFSDTHDLSALQITSYLSALGDADASLLSSRPQLNETLAMAYARISKAGARAVFMDAGKACRSIGSVEQLLHSLASDIRIITLAAPRMNPEEFSPFTQALTEDIIETTLSSSLRDSTNTIGRLQPAFKQAASSRLSGKLPESIVRGTTAFINLLLDALGDEGTIFLCDSPELFSTEARELIGNRLASGRGKENYIVLSSMEPPPSWNGSWLQRLAVPAATGKEGSLVTAAQIEAALGTCGDKIRHRLMKRFQALAADTTATPSASGLSEALGLLPKEARLYLYELNLAENVLDTEELKTFSSRLGLLPRGESLLQDLLSRAGMVDPADTRQPFNPLDIDIVASNIDAETVELLHKTYLLCLIDRYKAGSIRPSTAFLSCIGEREESAGITFDCLFDDALRPDSKRTDDTSFLSPPSACILSFWSALTSADAEAARQAMAVAGQAGTGPHDSTIKALMRTELAYAEGNIELTALGARTALLSHTVSSPPKLEARAHRMMGMTALASERYADASDYLTNAHELAEVAGDQYERMMAAYARAITEFMTGSLVKAANAADQAAMSAMNIFRMDGLAAVESLLGRVDLELGDYAIAAERYRKLEELGNKFNLLGVPARARIWQGRALAYAGDFHAAARLLEGEADDTEARIFMGELELLRGRPREARTWLDKPVKGFALGEFVMPERQRPFRPSDRFEWSSPFAEIEGRCIDFSTADAPLADLELALTLFAVGLDEQDAVCAEGLHKLTRSRRAAKANPGMGTYCFFCYLLEERLPDPPVDKLTVLSRAFKVLQQRAGRIESRIQREKYMEKNTWNRRLLEAARTHKFI